MRVCCKGFVSLIEGPFLEAILNTERELASCGRGSQPRAREVRKPPVGHYDPAAKHR